MGRPALAEKQQVVTFRVPAELRAEFFVVCQATDRSASQLLRDFMRLVVVQHRAKLAHKGGHGTD